FVLAMDVQQKWRQFTQCRDGAGLVINVNAIALVRRDLAADNDFVPFRVESEPVEIEFDVCFKNRFNDGSRFTCADHFRRGFRTGQQTEGIDDDGFAGAGLAGEQVKTGLEVKFELIDESKISYTKKSQHTRAL